MFCRNSPLALFVFNTARILPQLIWTPVGGNITLQFSSDAAVWILNPTIWNNHALSHQGFDRGILDPGDEALQGYKPSTKFVDMNKHPVALYGAHNSPRIVAQRGAFTIFGQSTSGMEELTTLADSLPTAF
jgi:hypothetical protein